MASPFSLATKTRQRISEFSLTDDDWNAYLRDHRSLLIGWCIPKPVNAALANRHRTRPDLLLRRLEVEKQDIPIVLWLNNLHDFRILGDIDMVLVPDEERWDIESIKSAFTTWTNNLLG